MPFVSRQQQKWGHTAEGEKALGGPAGVAEWDAATKGKELPKKLHEMSKPLKDKNG